jgi:hypothetical protein
MFLPMAERCSQLLPAVNPMILYINTNLKSLYPFIAQKSTDEHDSSKKQDLCLRNVPTLLLCILLD